jgi:HEAT repeat protein
MVDQTITEQVVSAFQEDQYKRNSIIEKLITTYRRKVVEVLIDLLCVDRWEYVRGAAIELQRIKDPRLFLHLREYLMERFTQGNFEVKVSVGQALALMHEPNISSIFLSGLHHADAIIRRKSASSLGDLGEVAAIDPLISLLYDDDITVRSAAASALRQIHHPDVAAHLIQLLATETNRDIRRHVYLILGMTKDPVALAPLLHALQDDDADIRCSAIDGLGILDIPEVFSPLIASLHDNEASVRARAANALGDLRDERAIEFLRDVYLHDEDATVRYYARDALNELHAP